MKQRYALQKFNFSNSLPVLILFLLFINPIQIQAQVVVTESFTGTQFPPFGWQQMPVYGVNSTNHYDRLTAAGTLPACVAHTGPGYVRYPSKTALPAASSIFISKRLDMSGRPSCNAAGTVSFWLYRDNYLPSNHDTIKIFMDTANTYNIATNPFFVNTRVLLNGPSPTPLWRPFADVPVAVANTWQQYTYNIPAGRCTDHEYIMIITGSAGGGNTYIDDISVTTWPTAQTFQSTNLTYQETSPSTKPSINQVVVGIDVKMNSAGTPALSLDSLSLNTNGTTSLADISNAKLWYTGGTSFFVGAATAIQFGTTIVNPSATALFPGNLTFKYATVPSGALTIGQKYVVAGNAGNSVSHNAITYLNGQEFTAVTNVYTIVTNPVGNCTVLPSFPMEVGDNYFWLTYDVLAGAVSGDCIDAEYSGCYVNETGLLNVANTTTLPGCREISLDYCNGVIPVMFWGTQEQSDFVRHVALWGEGYTNATLPILNNALNSVGPPNAPYFGGPAPFSAHPPDYELFDPKPGYTCVLKQGTTYAAPAIDYLGPGLTIQADADVGFDPNYVNVWIDFNHDGDFMEPGEQIIPAAVALYGLTTTNRAVTVPAPGGVASPGIAGAAGSIVGTTRMRVRASETVPALDPCTGGLVEGETEDYIVTVMPNCAAGVKTWLGYTDDWNTPANWCGGVPTINDIALVQFSASGTPAVGYHRPVIHNGVIATAQTIRLAAGDTLYADAESGASLTIRDSLNINFNTPGNGHVKVISNFASTATVSNGTLGFNITPFMASRKNARMQVVITAADFAAQGLVAGYVIDELWFDIISRATGTFSGVYNGFTLSYAYCAGAWNQWPANPPTALATAGAFTTIYSGNLDLNAPVISGGLGGAAATGTLKIPVSSILYTGGDIVFNFCYNNSPFTAAASNDGMRQTVTTNAYRTIWINNNNTTAPNYGCVLPLPPLVGNVAVAAQYRPNITFKYHKLFAKFPIDIGTSAASVNGVALLGPSKGFWNNSNNGAALTDGFQAGRSVVKFGSTLALQTIGGIKSTKFNDLTIDKSVGVVSQLWPTTVDSFLTFTNGALLLNNRVLTENYGMAAAVSRTNGYMVSEDPTNAGRFAWSIGANNIGLDHVFPFGVVGGNYLPVKINPAADLGTVSISTYNTVWANTPYPSPATHVNNSTGSPNNGTLTVDRFWVLDKTGPAANNATINFSYDNAEAIAPNVINKATLVAQRWVGSGWSAGIGASTVGGTVSAQNVTGVNSNFNGPWALTDIANPLPVELVLFNAAAVQDRVKIWWETASETDNDYFTVERSVDLKQFDFIVHVPTKGNGPVEHQYETYDLQPVMGMQYYRLKTTSLGNEENLSKVVAVKFDEKLNFDITAIAGYYESGLLGIDYLSDSDEACDLVLYDITGKPVYMKKGVATSTGSNHVDIQVNLSHAVYLVSLRNSSSTITRKVVY